MLTRYFFPDSITTGWLFLELFASGLLVILAAIRLTKLADRFADERGLGKAFVGMLLLATVTSLPEVVAGATAGAIGSMTLAVMSRATLGHSGQALHAGPGLTAAFLLVTLAAVGRVAAPLSGAYENAMLGFAALAWIAAFALFLITCGPALFGRRG